MFQLLCNIKKTDEVRNMFQLLIKMMCLCLPMQQYTAAIASLGCE